MLNLIVSPPIPEVNPQVPPEDYKPVIEYFDRHHMLIIRAHVIGHCFSNDELFLIVQPLGYLVCGQWHDVPQDDTAFKVSTVSLKIVQVG